MKQSCLITRNTLAILFSFATLLGCHRPMESPSHEEIMRAGLEEIISEQGSTCGSVLSYTVDDRLDYRVECESGDVYRIHIDQEGLVKLDRHESGN